MNYFILETQSDKGTLYLKTNASTKEIAINNFCSLYNAPINALSKVYKFDLMFWNFEVSTLISKNLAVLV